MSSIYITVTCSLNSLVNFLHVKVINLLCTHCVAITSVFLLAGHVFLELNKVISFTDGQEEHMMLGFGCTVHYMRSYQICAIMTTGQLRIPITYWETVRILRQISYLHLIEIELMYFQHTRENLIIIMPQKDHV